MVSVSRRASWRRRVAQPLTRGKILYAYRVGTNSTLGRRGKGSWTWEAQRRQSTEHMKLGNSQLRGGMSQCFSKSLQLPEGHQGHGAVRFSASTGHKSTDEGKTGLPRRGRHFPLATKICVEHLTAGQEEGSPCIQFFGGTTWPRPGEEGLDEKFGKSRGCWGQAEKPGWLPGPGPA